MKADDWIAEHVPELQGRRVLITGGNSGIGLEAARVFAGAGAAVVLGCRSLDKGKGAADDIRASHPGADVEVLELDLADLDSVEAAATAVDQRWGSLDVLCNNAGVMALPYRQTMDGFEMQFGTNHLGHFALTARLLDTLMVTPAPRVVTVSSVAHRLGSAGFDNLDAAKGYDKWRAYGTSKLANLRFTYELQRRAEKAGASLTATAAHPGYTRTNLQTAGPKMSGSKLGESAMLLANGIIGQSSRMGALPTVWAAVGADVPGGSYIGPRGLMEWRGLPKRVGATAAAHDENAGRRLWELSEKLTGVEFRL